MATLAKLIEDVIKRSKISIDEKKSLKSVLENSSLTSIEVNDEDYESVMSNLHNLETAEAVLSTKLVEKGRAEAYNSTDIQVHELADEKKSEGLLTDAQVAEIKSKKKVAEKLKLMSAYMKDNLEASIKGAKKDGDKDLETKLREELKKANDEMKILKDNFDSKVKELESKHESQILDKDLQFMLYGRNDIASDSLKERHFARNFMSDLEEYRKQEGIVINPKTKKLEKEDGTPYFTKTHEELDLDGLFGVVVDKYGYKKKSSGVEKTDISVEEGVELTPAQRRNLERSKSE